MKCPLFVMSALAIAGVAEAKKPEVQVDPGPPLTLQEYQFLAETAVRERLIDPESARFRWTYGYRLAPKGFASCFEVNSKNRLGGYTGFTWANVVIAQGRAVFVDVDDEDRGWTANNCRTSIRSGKYPPLR